jgi:hypothetical protein
LREFDKYKDLLKRPIIAKELVSERELMLAQLAVTLKANKDEFAVRNTLLNSKVVTSHIESVYIWSSSVFGQPSHIYMRYSAPETLEHLRGVC